MHQAKGFVIRKLQKLLIDIQAGIGHSVGNGAGWAHGHHHQGNGDCYRQHRYGKGFHQQDIDRNDSHHQKSQYNIPQRVLIWRDILLSAPADFVLATALGIRCCGWAGSWGLARICRTGLVAR